MTSSLVYGLLMRKNPTLDGLIGQPTESITLAIEKNKELGEEMIEFMDDFIIIYKPAHLAVLDWTKDTGVELI